MSEQALTWQSVPHGFALCIHSDCPQASTCLRAIAFGLLPDDERRLTMVNPKRCTKSADCPEYKDSQPVRYALGFTQIQEQLLPSQYDAFLRRLQSLWGRKNYYRFRKGEIPMSPTDQQQVRHVLREIGASEGLDFDRYEDLPAWKD